MAGGTFTSYDKQRPGAYINFQAARQSGRDGGSRGVMTLPLPLSWGEEGALIPVYAQDLLGGKGMAKVGMGAFDPQAAPLRQGLSYAWLCHVWRADRGGTAASAYLDGTFAQARYPGALGNRLTVAVTEGAHGRLEAVTYLDGVEKARQVAARAEELADNDWVRFSGEGPLRPGAGVALTGGTDGVVSEESYDDYFNAAANASWNAMALPTRDAAVIARARAFIRAQREDEGRRRQIVAVDCPHADYEGVISVDQGYVTLAGETVPPEAFAAAVAGMTAAAEINQSNTYRVLEDAAAIVGELYGEEVSEALRAGKLVITRRQDGAVVIEQDINTLHTFSADKGAEFRKNRVLRVLDEVAGTVARKFECGYLGRVRNDAQGRALFKADILGYLGKLQAVGALRDLNPKLDLRVAEGDEPDSVLVELALRPADSLEKLYMTIKV